MLHLWTWAAKRLPFAFAVLLLLATRPVPAQTLGLAAPTVGDCTTSATGTTTCRKTNGVAFAPSATADASLGTVVYEKSYWTDLSDFTVAGTAPTISNGKIVWTAANNGNFVNSLALTNTGNDDDELDVEVTFTLGSGTWGTNSTSSSYGLGVGKLASNPSGNQWGAAAFYNTYFGPANVQTFLVTGAGGSAPAQVGANVPVGTGAEGQGQVLTAVYSQRGPRFYSFVRDATQSARAAASYDMLTANCNAQFPNSTRAAIWNNGGTFTILSMRVVSRKRQQPDIAVVGDSKSFGCDASIRDLRFGSQINALGVVSVYAGSGDTTQSVLNDLPYILAARPKAVLLNIGRNDLAQGIAAATWQANYSSIVSQLKAAGVRVVHLLPIPETAQDQSSLKNFITTTFSGDTVIDPAPGWSNSTMLASDNIHPSTAGHAYLASLILASGVFPAVTGAVYQPPLASSVVFPTQ